MDINKEVQQLRNHMEETNWGTKKEIEIWIEGYRAGKED